MRGYFVHALAGEGQFLEVVAALLVNAPAVSRQKASIRGLAETQGNLAGKALIRPVALKPLTIEAEHAGNRQPARDEHMKQSIS